MVSELPGTAGAGFAPASRPLAGLLYTHFGIEQDDFLFARWQARRASNPQPMVLETITLPIELRAYIKLVASFELVESQSRDILRELTNLGTNSQDSAPEICLAW